MNVKAHKKHVSTCLICTNIELLIFSSSPSILSLPYPRGNRRGSSSDKCLKIWWMGKYTIKSNYKRRYHCESTTIIRITLIQMSMCCCINEIEDICMLFKWYIIYFLYIRIVIENNHEHGTKIISFRHTDILGNPHEWQSLYRQDCLCLSYGEFWRQILIP